MPIETRIKFKDIVRHAGNSLGYRLSISKKEHLTALKSAREFSQEFLGFLSAIMPEGIVELHPSSIQVEVLYHLIESTQQKTTREVAVVRKTPGILEIRYLATAVPESNSVVSVEDILRGIKTVYLGMNWAPKGNHPVLTNIDGIIGAEDSPQLLFMFSPEHIGDAEDIGQRAFGNRVIWDDTKGSDQYVHLGAFESGLFNRQIHVYGHNTAVHSYRKDLGLAPERDLAIERT